RNRGLCQRFLSWKGMNASMEVLLCSSDLSLASDSCSHSPLLAAPRHLPSVGAGGGIVQPMHPPTTTPIGRHTIAHGYIAGPTIGPVPGTIARPTIGPVPGTIARPTIGPVPGSIAAPTIGRVPGSIAAPT